MSSPVEGRASHAVSRLRLHSRRAGRQRRQHGVRRSPRLSRQESPLATTQGAGCFQRQAPRGCSCVATHPRGRLDSPCPSKSGDPARDGQVAFGFVPHPTWVMPTAFGVRGCRGRASPTTRQRAGCHSLVPTWVVRERGHSRASRRTNGRREPHPSAAGRASRGRSVAMHAGSRHADEAAHPSRTGPRREPPSVPRSPSTRTRAPRRTEQRWLRA